MALENQGVPKRKRKATSTRVIYCTRCGKNTTHSLYNTEEVIYRCVICGSLIEKK